MTTSYTSLLGLALPVTGELQGTWGDVVNQQITDLLDAAVAGTTTLSVDADVTLSTTVGAANQARQAILLWTATGTATRYITAPAQSKAYLVINKTGGTQSIVIRGVGPTTGVTVPANRQTLVAWNGSDFVEIAAGNVSGPASSTDNAIARFDGTTGELIQNSGPTIDDDGNMVISSNSTGDALRITQTGTGNALVVEDDTNPDSTPFVVDASGNVGIGSTNPGVALDVYRSGAASTIRTTADGAIANIISQRSSDDATGALISPRKTRGTSASPSIVLSGDTVGIVSYGAYDGSAIISAAQVSAQVDGTPGTNDMPGRLVFSTTADGASSPTERMRIDSAGQVGIGGTPSAGRTLQVSKQVTGSINGTNVFASGQVQSDVTSLARGFLAQTNTASANFALPNYYGYQAVQGTLNNISAGGSVTNQIAFLADSSLTGATNNYGFYSDIAAGTGRWNFYAAGTADNYFGGPTVVSVNSSSDALRITQTGAGNALLVEDSANPDSTPFVIDADGKLIVGHTSAIFTGAAFVLGTDDGTSRFHQARYSNNSTPPEKFFSKSRGTSVGTNTIVASGDIVGQISFRGADGTSYLSAAQINAAVDGTPGTNDMPGRLMFSTTADGASSPTERMRIDSAGQVGIGGTPSAGQAFFIARAPTGNTVVNQVLAQYSVQSDVTAQTRSFASAPGTAAASFTLGQLHGFYAGQGTFGLGSTVTNQFGFTADSSLTGATNNYGFYSDVAAGTGRWNFFAGGTANNAFAGSSSFGATSAPTALVTIAAGTATASTAPLKFTSGTNLTTPEAGVIEYDGTVMTATSNTSFKRGTIPITNYTSGIGTSGITATTDYAIFPSANDTITLPVGTYLVRMAVRIAVAGSTVNQPCTLNVRGGGTAVGSFSWRGTGSILDAGAASSFVVAATALGTVITVTATSAANPRQYIFVGEGILKVTTAGTIIPAYQFPGTLTSGTTTLVADNYMTIQQLDSQSAAAFGPAGTGWG